MAHNPTSDPWAREPICRTGDGGGVHCCKSTPSQMFLDALVAEIGRNLLKWLGLMTFGIRVAMAA
eukprot:8977893-Prorocentrum_lima.AAC.1